MKRLTGWLVVLALTAVGGSLAWAQMPDPLHIGESNTPAALEGSYITESGMLQFLVVGSPRGCNDGSDPTDCPNVAHLWFYNAACNRVEDLKLPLTANDVEIVPLHDPTVTQVRTGNVLVAATPPGGPFDLPILADNPLIGKTYYFDTNRGIARMETMARLSGFFGNGWTDYRPAAVLLVAPPDDGVTFFNTLLVRCPAGTAVQAANSLGGTVLGTIGTLGGDMLDLAAQNEGAPSGSSFDKATTQADVDTLCDDCETNGTFAAALTAIIYDLDENFLRSVDNMPCRCIGVGPQGGTVAAEPRLATLAPIAATTATYWEIFSFGKAAGEELFAAAHNLQVKLGSLNVNLFGRLHNARDRANIEE